MPAAGHKFLQADIILHILHGPLLLEDAMGAIIHISVFLLQYTLPTSITDENTALLRICEINEVIYLD